MASSISRASSGVLCGLICFGCGVSYNRNGSLNGAGMWVRRRGEKSGGGGREAR